MKDIRDFQLLEYNTFGIEGKCRRFVEFDTVDELKSVLASLTPADNPLMVLGGGSNLLLTRDFPGTVLHSNIVGRPVVERTADETGDFLVTAGSGMIWDDFVDFCVENGIYGAENLSLIPGTVGASAVQNIGAYGVEAKDIIYKVEAVEIATGKTVTFSNSDCRYAYRQSRFKTEWKGLYVVTNVTYRLSSTFTPHLDYGNIKQELERIGIINPTANELRRVIIHIRETKLPDTKVEGNAGSFFMNPVVDKSKYDALALEYPGMPHYTVDPHHEKIPAGWMIDRCGWKGKTVGRAGVHDKQALVLVNRGGATGSEIVELCNLIRKDVYEKFGIEINPEVNII
ncbi:MAG: UDP-N-acetylmuramate dehydrogenase [Prevotella sp.]|nr:UDP-N-acetylmuramate dehydrogenase [Prevotella sp.]